MAVSLKGMNRKELEKLKADIEKALVKLADDDKKAAKAAAEKAALAHGFSLEELTGGAKRGRKAGKKTSGPKGAPKYANPADTSQTWTGRGRQPAWIKEGLGAGKSLEDFAI
ncbi:H-NS family nucleoid-associated regulatory protein [Oceanicola sp. 502str15]|uniref:H-NS histone family protein n=1 Tax=Oceanicola sp. 502str15 TaxID=2696061 RepID=UPI0020962809|nr:H-NS histone family protein [Oceanicola sp. 502str15]MCO6383227.1 H-NS histone family protein [Oceanicola sp. 502str15]